MDETNSESASHPTKQYAVVPLAKHSIADFPVIDVRQDLVSIYEHYCVAYPNPTLAVENEERDRLLQAISAADHAVQVNPKKKQKRGFFGSIFGSNTEDDTDTRRVQVLDDDERLNYSPTELPPNDTWLLGTEFSLDTSNIPDEAHAVARHHMMARQPNLVRGSTAVAVAPGLLAWDGALVSLPINGVDQVSCFIAHSRLALVHPNLLAVCWHSTEVILYEQRGTDWQPVAGFGPTRAVQEHLLNTEWDFDGSSSALLAVTDVLAWDEATLVVARLGGFLEVILLDQPQSEPLSVTTSEYHVDVLGIEIVADNVLAAHGRSTDQHQIITFWTMDDGGMNLLQEVDLDVLGPHVSIFCTPVILQHWRKPRTVSLRNMDSQQSVSEAPVSTISISVPIVTMKCRDDRYLAVLDWNGGVSVLDCNFTSSVFQILLPRTTTPHVGVQSMQWIDDALVTVNRKGRLNWKNKVIASLPRSSITALSNQQMVIQNGSMLQVCSIQELTASAIVQSFVMNEQYAEALAAAERLSDSERQTIHEDVEHCKKMLWEQDGDVQVLASMHDDAFIISQSLVKADHTDYRAVLRLALKRLSSVKLSASLTLASTVEELEQLREKIRDRLMRYGTYELLCSYLSMEPNLDDFFEKFVDTAVADLAHHFARSAEIAPATILWIRHMPDLDTLALVDDIPLSIPPRTYEHLLPAFPFGSFLNSEDGVSDLSQFPSDFAQRFDCDVVTDEEDEAMVLESAREQMQLVNSDTRVITSWYSKRLSAISNYVPTLRYIGEFGELALRAIPDANESTKELFRFSGYAKAVLGLVSSGDDLENDVVSLLVSLTPENFKNISLSDLVAITLDCPGDSMHDRFHKLLLPLITSLEEHDQQELVQKIDQAVSDFSTETLRRCHLGNAVEVEAFIAQATKCSELTWASRSSLNRDHRLISDTITLTALVMKMVDEVMLWAASAKMSDAEQVQVVYVLWKMYESLPSKSIGELGEGNCRGEEADQLYKDLVALDVCARWPLSMQSFPKMPWRHQKETVDLSYGEGVISCICRSACSQLKSLSTNPKILDHFIRALLEDVKIINSQCFKGSLDLKFLLHEHLVQPILHLEQIHFVPVVLASLLAATHSDPKQDSPRNHPSLIAERDLSNLVLDFFKEAVYSKGNLDIGFKTQELLAPYLPDLSQEFSSSRLNLDAASHIRNVLLPQDKCESFSPRHLRETPPLDVIDSILSKNPSCFIQHCMQWSDAEWSQKSNHKIREHLKGGIPARDLDLPPLPGLPVYHLAQLLSLEGGASVISVKSRVIHHAVNADLFGAAAAVCRTLLVDTHNTNSNPEPVLRNVAEIVGNDRYSDYETKQELCESVFFRFTSLTQKAAALFNTIVAAWVSVEFRGAEVGNSPNQVANTFAFIYANTTEDYGTKLEDLFSTLRFQLSDSDVDDKILDSLARYISFWCFSSRRRRFTPEQGAVVSIDRAACLSVSLLLHLTEREQLRQSCLELQKLFSEQRPCTDGDSSASYHGFVPDKRITQSLVHRGYSENGATKAVIATKNEGFDQALQWAIAHSTESTFDDPLVFIRQQVDMDGLAKPLCDLNRLNDAWGSLASDMGKSERTSLPSQHVNAGTADLPKAAAISILDDSDGWSDFDEDDDKLDDPAENNFSASKNDDSCNYSAGPPQKDTVVQQTEVPSSSLVSEAPPHISRNGASTSCVPESVTRNSTETPKRADLFSPLKQTSQRDAPLPRSMLLQVGQAAFQNAKKIHSPMNEERQRLLEQGRAFFKQVHHASSESFPTETALNGEGAEDETNNWEFEDDLSL